MKLLLIDGHSILNRAFYGLPDLTNSRGEHTGAIYGFLTMLQRYIETEQPDNLTVAFDVHAPTFRHEMFEGYKGTRKPMAPELKEQVPRIQELLKAMDIPVVTMAGWEADDLLGTLAGIGEKSGFDVTIVSGDRDLLQLATKHVKISIPKTKMGGTEIENYFAQDVLEKYGVTPKQFIDVKALWGDTADNIPGVEGIGEKTATALIAQYGSIEECYAHVDEIKPPRASKNLKEQWDTAVLSKTLATININAPVELDVEASRMHNIYTPAAYTLVKQYEFKKLLSRFEETAAGAQDQGKVAPSFEVPEFVTLTDMTEIDRVFARYETSEYVGASLVVADSQFYGVAVSDGSSAYYIPVFFLVTEPYLTEALLKLGASKARLVFWDMKGACHTLGRDISDADDISVAAYLLDPLKSNYLYDDIASSYLDFMVPAEGELLGKKKLKDLISEDVTTDVLRDLNCNKAFVAAKAFPVIMDCVRDAGMADIYYNIELPLTHTLYDMEIEGIAMDVVALKEFGNTLTSRIRLLEQAIYEAAGEEFNINSPKQLGVILFEKMGIEGGKKTKTGYSTAADVLEALAPDYPIVNNILEYRQLAKLNSTYVEGLSNAVSADGRVHSTFMQTVTATGRISSTEPNLQNIPIRMELGRQIRKVFYPKKGFVFLDADYSQIELRVLAHMSGDEALIGAFKAGQDIHRSTASLVFKTPFDEVTDLQRRRAKAVNFGIVYGISAFGLAADLGIGRIEAKQYIDDYFVAYPKMKEFINGLVEEGKEKGCVKTMAGRIRPIPELSSSNFMQRQFGERVAMNSPIQGTAADIIKIAMVRVHDRLKAEGLESRLLLQVHDELLIETKLEELEKVKAIMASEMESAVKLSVDLEIDMHQGNTWYEAK
ncbi:MAG: DNA polymerase I [Pseudobutyrivibrio sp.]|nr:DNA polymerase I [Pseudobutyrivibrio sp.]